MKFANSFPAVLFSSAVVVALVQPQMATAVPSPQVATIARQVTVQIQGQAPGSGVIVAKQGQTYYVLTAAHVVATQDEYDIVTPDGKKYRLDYNLVKKFPDVDLALLQFTSAQTYQVVAMGSSSQLKPDDPMYVSGFPISLADSVETTYQLSEGEMGGIATRPTGQGYALAYLTYTFAGMSGGPILNQQGQLMGIHGSSKTQFSGTQGIDPEFGTKEAINLGIPIDTFLRSVTRVNPVLKFPPAPPLAESPQLTASDLVIQAANQFIEGKTKEALTTSEEAIRLQPNYASAYLARGYGRLETKDYKGAIADVDQAIRLNPNSVFARSLRGAVCRNLKDYRGAIANYDEVIRLNPSFASVYFWRGFSLAQMQDYEGAITNYDEAIRLNPDFVSAYFNRGFVRFKIKDYRGAIADYGEAIRLNPAEATSYSNRGSLRAGLKDYAGALADLEKAAELVKAQEKSSRMTPFHQEILEKIKILQKMQR